MPKSFRLCPKRARQLVSTRSVSKSNRTNSTSAVVIHEAFLTFWSERACAAQHWGGRGQDCAIETRQSISCMDIRVTARVGVLVAIGNACKRPFDSLLIMKWWRLRNNLGKSGERWSGLVVRWAWRTWRKWGLGDNLL
jgi:hypothetical protein